MSEDNNQISLYEMFGGESNLKILVSKFYQIMDENKDYKILRDMHAKDLTISEEKLFMFLSGWMGGPQLYINKYGHPRLRARHMSFPITNNDSLAWISCMKEAMNFIDVPQNIKDFLIIELSKTASFMVNKLEK